jgi:hypothetical protein
LVRLSAQFKKSVNDSLDGLAVICEDGIAEWLVGARSFGEGEYFRFDRPSFASTWAGLKRYLYNRFLLKYHRSELARNVRRMSSIQDLVLIRAELFRTYAPEPEGMNALLSLSGSGTIEDLQGQPCLRIRRCAYEAREAERFAAQHCIRELHIVVGCAHELPVEYFLTHPRVLDRIVV